MRRTDNLIYISTIDCAHLAGKPLIVSTSAGNVPAAYAPGGASLFTMEEQLRPLQATAHRQFSEAALAA